MTGLSPCTQKLLPSEGELKHDPFNSHGVSQSAQPLQDFEDVALPGGHIQSVNSCFTFDDCVACW